MVRFSLSQDSYGSPAAPSCTSITANIDITGSTALATSCSSLRHRRSKSKHLSKNREVRRPKRKPDSFSCLHATRTGLLCVAACDAPLDDRPFPFSNSLFHIPSTKIGIVQQND